MVILSFYEPTMVYLNALMEYADQHDMAIQGNTGTLVMVKSRLSGLKGSCEGLIPLAYTACGVLCHFLGDEFKFPAVGVADDKDVTDESKMYLRTLIAQITPLSTNI
jgi:hypothetical protein